MYVAVAFGVEAGEGDCAGKCRAHGVAVALHVDAPVESVESGALSEW